MQPGACQQGGALVDLVEGVGAEYQGAAGGGNDRLGEGEQRLPGAVYRQDLLVRIHRRQPETSLQPAGDGLAQCGDAGGGGVVGQFVQVVCYGRQHEGRRRVPRLAYGQVDGAPVRRGRGPGE